MPKFYPKDDVTVSVTELSRRHCRTCTCTISEIEVTRKVRVSSPPSTRREKGRRDRGCPECGCRAEEREVYRMPLEGLPVRRSPRSAGEFERKVYLDHKYSLLEGWFRRFDIDGNGFLDLYDLQLLLKDLGFSLKTANIKKIFDRADRDDDGFLSLQEFLLMWRHTALDEDDLLSPIIRKYQIYPDVYYPDSHHRKHVQEDLGSERCVAARCRHGEPLRPFAASSEELYSHLSEVVRDVMDLERDSPGQRKGRREQRPVFSCYR